MPNNGRSIPWWVKAGKPNPFTTPLVRKRISESRRMQQPEYSSKEDADATMKAQMHSTIKREVRPEIGRALQEMIREEDSTNALYLMKADKLERDAALLHKVPEFVEWTESSARKFREMAAQERSHRDRLQDMLRGLQSLQLE